MYDERLFEIELPSVDPESLVRLGEDFLRAYSILHQLNPRHYTVAADREYVSSISSLISRSGSSPAGLSPAEVALLTATFRKAISSSLPRLYYSWCPWFRLYTQFLFGSRIFPSVELCGESPDYTPFGLADIWKGNYHGEPVCIKAIRAQDSTPLRRVNWTITNGRGSISHPNVLPIIEVSETPVPFCIMSPWLQDGNIIQYTQMNPGADRLLLLTQVCQGLMHLHGLSILHGSIAPGNILITRGGQACLGDFGIAGAFRDLTYHDHKLETLRYMPPERLSWGPMINNPSEESDIYSLSMTSFEVLTGISPFSFSERDSLIAHIRGGELPSRPKDPNQNQWLQDRVWDTITTCWSTEPQRRCQLSIVYHVFSTPCPQDALVEFPPVGRKNLIRLAEELLYTFLVLPLDPGELATLRTVQGHISNVISTGGTSPAISSSAESVALAGTFREATSILSSLLRPPSFRLWLRLYTHALLLELRIFPDMELYDEPLNYVPTGFTDIWKGNYHGELVCIKAIRTQDPTRLRELRSTFRRKINGRRFIAHPNLLPIIEASEALLLFCIMSPWMPDGNITQYTQMNPDAERLPLLAQVCQGLMHLHRLSILHGGITPNNILITRDGRACLSDFGIADAFGVLESYYYKSETIRYIAPERLAGAPTIAGPSRQSDVYSFVMSSFEVLTGILPYDDSDRGELVTDIRGGKRPSRPTDPSQDRWLQDHVWNTIVICWSNEPEQRHELSVVYHVFSTPSPQDAQNVKSDKIDAEKGSQQRGRIIPRIASFFQSLRGSEPEIERLVNEMDKRLADHTISDRERLKLLNRLCKTCSRHRVIPKSMHIPDCSEGAVEVERGGFADVSQGTYQGRRVAIKVVRVYITSDLDVIRSSFCREGVAWKHLRHPNILPLLGVTVSKHRFAMVSEWMENGNISEFVAKDKHVNRTELLVDVANGLAYMHSLHMVHGDLKGANILINKDRRACLADFGLLTITGIATHAAAGSSRASLISNETLMSFTAGGTRRWMSPELLDPSMFGIPEPEGDRPTRQSDCYALGMVIYEVLCGHHPYAEIQSDIMVVNEIMEGTRPEKPEGAKRLGFSSELWRTVELCWQQDRNARPGIEDILSCLNDAAAFWYMRES